MNKPKIYYDKQVDALWIRVKKGAETDSEEIAPGMTVEYNNKGDIIGLEILNASTILHSMREGKLEMLKRVQYA